MNINIPNAITPRSGLLLGGQPSMEALQAAQTAGFQTIINLRGVGEAGTDLEPQIVADLGMKYVHIPVNGAGGITAENALRLSQSMSEAGDESVMVHCASGNRVGALFALAAHQLDGLSAEDALLKGRQHGLTGLEPLVRALLGLA
jgi:uncharacterized protein (TIGR01244 family)